MLSLKSVFAGLGAVAALYIAAFLFRFVTSSRPGTATGLGALQGDAAELLLHPFFRAAAVAIFLGAAFWARE